MSSLLSKVLGKPVPVPVCPMCSGTQHVRKIRTVEVGSQAVTVLVCKDPAFRESGDMWSKPTGSCRVTSFGVLPDGSRVIGSDERISLTGVDKKTDRAWEKKVFPTDEQMVAQVVAAVRARIVTPRSTRRYCYTRTCAQFGKQTQWPFCGRCGYDTQDKGVGIAFPDGFRLAICGNDGCPAKGKRRTVAKLNIFCETCGQELPPDMDRDADAIAAVAGRVR